MLSFRQRASALTIVATALLLALPVAAQEGTPFQAGHDGPGGVETVVVGGGGGDVAVLAYCSDLDGPFGASNAIFRSAARRSFQ